MPKLQRIAINLNLLKPQSQPQKLSVKLIKWLLGAGRYIIIFVEALVLIAFLSRFKLDADISSVKEQIDEQVPFLESLKNDEQLIRQVQFQLTTIKDLKQNTVDLAGILKSLSSQVPQGVILTNINMERSGFGVNMKITGNGPTELEVASLLNNLKNSKEFVDVFLSSISLEDNSVSFSISAKTNQNLLHKL